MSNKKTYTWYDMEQEIFKCWNVVDDLKMLSEEVNNGSDFTNTLKGVAELYHYRFEKLWALYEKATEERFAERKGDDSVSHSD